MARKGRSLPLPTSPMRAALEWAGTAVRGVEIPQEALIKALKMGDTSIGFLGPLYYVHATQPKCFVKASLCIGTQNFNYAV